MIPHLGYLQLPQSLIEDRDDFYRSGIKEASKIRNLISTAQRMFVVPSKGVRLYLLGEKDAYCVELYDKSSLVCKLYYLPKDMRLDLYDGGNSEEPMVAWKSKKCIYNTIPVTLGRVNALSLLLPLLAVL